MKYKEYLKKEKPLSEGNTSQALDKIDVGSKSISIKISDSDGNKTKDLNMDNKGAVMALKQFIEKRLKEV